MGLRFWGYFSKSYPQILRTRQKYLPTVLPESSLVSYVWRNIPENAVPQLRIITERLTHIGRAASLVRGTIIDAKSVSSTLLPAPAHQTEYMLRVPYPGRLDDLQTAYRAGFWPSIAPAVAYQEANTVIPQSEWADLIVLRPERQLAMDQSVYWCCALREAIMSRAPEPIPVFIHGHGNHRHLAWTALPAR